ncbi:MAG: radical SAM protein, partial [bacterium]|nr:radical SAM protein [bacterium]
HSIFDKMKEENIVNFLDQLKTMGVFCIVLTGGEPFLNVNVSRFISIATEMNFVLEIFSNLQKIPSWLINNDVNKFRIGRFQTSIYSVRDCTHDLVTRQHGSLQRTLRNLFILRDKGWCVEVATPLMKFNYDERNEIKEFFSYHNISQNFAWPIVNEYCNKNSRKSDLNITPDQFAKFSFENKDFIIETNSSKKDACICEAGKALISIKSNGDVYPCSQLPLVVGNVTEQNIAAIYNSVKMKQVAFLKNKQIGKEKTYNYCIGTNYAETGNFFQEPDYVLASIDKALE